MPKVRWNLRDTIFNGRAVHGYLVTMDVWFNMIAFWISPVEKNSTFLDCWWAV